MPTKLFFLRLIERHFATTFFYNGLLIFWLVIQHFVFEKIILPYYGNDFFPASIAVRFVNNAY